MSVRGAMLTQPTLFAFMTQACFTFMSQTALTLFAQTIALAQIVPIDALSAVVLARTVIGRRRNRHQAQTCK